LKKAAFLFGTLTLFSEGNYSFLMMKFIFSFCFLFSILSHAKVVSGVVENSKGHFLAYEMSISKSSGPTLVLFPGINRGLSVKTKDKVLKLLTEQGINWVSFHFAGHPQSVISSRGQSVGLDSLKLSDLANDSKELVEKLEIEQPLLVTLSYSGAVGAQFSSEDFPLLVDVAPIAKQIDDDPKAAAKAKEDQKKLEANCFMMSPCIEYWTQMAYRTHWAKMVQTQTESNYPELENSFFALKTLDGYVGMARATEKYDINTLDFAAGPQRIFLIGRDENPYRFTQQIKAIKNYRDQIGELPTVFLLEGAGHIVPTDQPESYVKVMAMILNSEIPKRYRFFDVQKNGGKIGPIKNSEVEKLLQNIR
jgi:pimeloyl-ACP methyl ester carboxylesterase